MISHKSFVERLLLIWGDSIPDQYRLFAVRHQLSNLIELLENDIASIPNSPLLLDFLKQTIESLDVSVTKDECLDQLDGALTKNTCLALSIFDLTTRKYRRAYLGALYLQVSLVFALLSVDPKEFETKTDKEKDDLRNTIGNASYEIALLLRESRSLITEAPNTSFTGFFDLLFRLKALDSDRVKIPDVYWEKLVKKGMSYLSGPAFSQLEPRKYRPRLTPVELPYEGHEIVSIPLKGEGEDELYHLLLELQPLSSKDDEPLFAGRRRINSRTSIESKEQSGVQLCPSRLSVSEKMALTNWIRNSDNDIAKSLVLLMILTSWRHFEVLGTHVALNEGEVDSYKEQNDVYGVFDLFTGIYWRKEPSVDDAYISSTKDEKWLHRHSVWLPIVIPNEFLIPLKETFTAYGSGRVLDLLSCKSTKQFNLITLEARHKIREIGGLSRKVTLRSLRYFLYGEVADEYGQHIASLMFSNTEFMGPICHYYMALDIGTVSGIYANVVNKIGFSLPYFSPEGSSSYIGSQLAINSDVFSQRLQEKLNVLEGLLGGIKSCSDIDTVRLAYNELCGYTLSMFFFCSSHRRLSSSFVELSMLTEDFSHALIADKLHMGESASRLLPLPLSLRRQIESAISHIANIAENTILSSSMRMKLLASIRLNGKEPFLGFWSVNNEMLPSSTAHIANFFGDDWGLPQNCMRQFSFQMLLAHQKGARYLLRQMGHSTADTHPFGISSLIAFDGVEDSEHREIFEDLLDSLGFKALRNARKPLVVSYNERSRANIRWPANTKLAKKQSTKKEKSDIEKSVQEACQLCLDGDTRTVYELLQERFSGDPNHYSYALKFLAKHVEDLDLHQPLTKDQIQGLIDYKIFTPQMVEMIYPFDTPVSIRRYTEYEKALNLASEAVLYAFEVAQVEDIEMTLFCSLLLDGDIEFIQECKTHPSEVTIKNTAYTDGAMIANVADKTMFIGGRSSILLAVLLSKFNKTDIIFNFRDLLKRLNHWLSVSKQDDYSCLLNHQKFLVKLAVVISGITSGTKSQIISLINAIKNAPRPGELGVQYALRQKKLTSKSLALTKLARLMCPETYFPLYTDDFSQPHTKPITQIHFVSDSKAISVNEFCKDFFRFTNGSKSNSFKTIELFWLKLLGCEEEKSFSELIAMSSSIPEIAIFILSWLYHWSKRKGRSGRKSGLRLSTIKSYFSRVGRPLVNILGSSSLQKLDSDELLDVYQQVIDSGNIDSRIQRLSALQSFHKVCNEHFFISDVDWHDLDIELPSSQYDGNIITPTEFMLAQELIQNDIEMVDDDKLVCQSILILCYRVGLRRGEVRRLQVDNFNFDDGLCHVRSSYLGDVKSVSGNRRIPFKILLPAKECHLIKSLVMRASKNGKNTLLFFSQYRKDKIRPMDKLFSRVVEALRITTGDPKIRLHDCRHSAISFIVTALTISADKQDPIAKAVKSYLPNGDVANFKEQIKCALLAPVSPQSALLPAIAQMVGHSKASTTIIHYLHLTHYWLWCALEQETKASSHFDKAIARITGISVKNIRVRKTRECCSAAKIAVSTLLDEKFSVVKKCQGVVRPNHQLSNWKQVNVSKHIEELANIEKALRYLEFLSEGQKLNGEKALELTQLPELERFDLDSRYVDSVSRAYQNVMAEDFIVYRAFNILSRDAVEVLPVEYRSKETKKYFKSENFLRLLELLFMHQSQSPKDLDVLLNIWQSDWDANTHSFKIKVSQADLWESCLSRLGVRVTYSDNTIIRKFKSIQWACYEAKSAMSKTGKISLPQLSHILFLLTIQRKLQLLDGQMEE